MKDNAWNRVMAMGMELRSKKLVRDLMQVFSKWKKNEEVGLTLRWMERITERTDKRSTGFMTEDNMSRFEDVDLWNIWVC